VVVIKITKNEPNFWGISISNNDLVGGSLAYPSFVQIGAISSLEKNIICDVIGTVTPEKMREIKIQMSDFFCPERSRFATPHERSCTPMI